MLDLIEGGWVIKGQVVAVIIAWILTAAGTLILLKVVDALMGLRVLPEVETEALDISQHGEEGYIFIE